MNTPADTRKGILLIDLMVAMAIIGVVLLAVMPTIRSEGPLQLVAGSTMLAADVEYAQSRTLSDPSDPVVVVFDPDGTTYWLAHLSDHVTPIDDPDGDPWVRVMGEGAADQLDGCTLARYELPSLPDDGPEVIIYDEFGRLETDNDLAIGIVNSTGEQVVHVRAATGSVEILAELPQAFIKDEGANKGDGLGRGGELGTLR